MTEPSIQTRKWVKSRQIAYAKRRAAWMDSREKQFLNAEEVEANPAIFRHPDARQKCSNRPAGCRHPRKSAIPGPFSWRLWFPDAKEPSLQGSEPLRLGRSWTEVKPELAQHGFKPEENGFLPCTFLEQFVEYGVEMRRDCARHPRSGRAEFLSKSLAKAAPGNVEHIAKTLAVLADISTLRLSQICRQWMASDRRHRGSRSHRHGGEKPDG